MSLALVTSTVGAGREQRERTLVGVQAGCSGETSGRALLTQIHEWPGTQRWHPGDMPERNEATATERHGWERAVRSSLHKDPELAVPESSSSRMSQQTRRHTVKRRNVTMKKKRLLLHRRTRMRESCFCSAPGSPEGHRELQEDSQGVLERRLGNQ